MKQLRFFMMGSAVGPVLSCLIAMGYVFPCCAVPSTVISFVIGLFALHPNDGVHDVGFHVVNILSCGVVGVLIAKGLRSRQRMQQETRIHGISECPICGHRRVTPESARCPECGHFRAFAHNFFDRPAGHVLCDGCGYDLTGNVSGVCPECGEPY